MFIYCKLHTNIRLKEGIKAVETTLKYKNKTTSVIINFLKLFLLLNHFILNCKNYLQIKGCAMGTKCTCTYAKIFVPIFEEKYIYLLINEICKLYLGHIVNIFLIWTGTLVELNKFIAKIKKVYPSIKFDFNYSSNSVNFLDTTVKKIFHRKTCHRKQIVKLIFTKNQNTLSL